MTQEKSSKNQINLLSLLSLGYFPRELPPPFTSKPFGKYIYKNRGELNPSITNFGNVAKLVSYNVSRVGISRRMLKIPNPILHANLCMKVIDEWTELKKFSNTSDICYSKPTFDEKGIRAIVPKHDYDYLDKVRAKIRSTSKYILVTDISKFYSSIYTHSIPWAIHTKEFAKNNYDIKFLGNSLDKWIRNGQDRQTVGIPIGPDTSFLIAEVILNQLDIRILERIGFGEGLRYVDDYEFGFKRYSDAEEALSIIQATLQSYELEVNLNKTEIMELPKPLVPYWVSELSQYEFRTGTIKQYTDLKRYFSRAFSMSKEYPHKAVLKYAVRRLKSVEIKKENWSILQDLLFQCMSIESSTIVSVLEAFIGFEKSKDFPIDLEKLEQEINYHIKYHSPLGHSSEVAWSLWAVIYWKLSIYPDVSEKLSAMNDSIVALLTLDANSKGLVSNLDTSLWETYMNKKELYGKQWLLSYEANVKGWLTTDSNSDYVDNDENFRLLKNNGVEFYELSKSDWVIPTPFY